MFRAGLQKEQICRGTMFRDLLSPGHPYSIGGEVVGQVDQFCHTILGQELLVGDVEVVPPEVEVLQAGGDEGLLQHLLHLHTDTGLQEGFGV